MSVKSVNDEETEQELENIRLKGELQDRDNSQRVAMANLELRVRTEEREKVESENIRLKGELQSQDSNQRIAMAKLELRVRTEEREKVELENIRLKGELQNQNNSQRAAMADLEFKVRTEEQGKAQIISAQDKLTIATLTTGIEEAKRKAEQGSQQLQGAALQLTVERILRKEFEPTSSGYWCRGADHLVMVGQLSTGMSVHLYRG